MRLRKIASRDEEARMSHRTRIAVALACATCCAVAAFGGGEDKACVTSEDSHPGAVDAWMPTVNLQNGWCQP